MRKALESDNILDQDSIYIRNHLKVFEKSGPKLSLSEREIAKIEYVLEKVNRSTYSSNVNRKKMIVEKYRLQKLNEEREEQKIVKYVISLVLFLVTFVILLTKSYD